jgi:2Fe-2S ferredoxin
MPTIIIENLNRKTIEVTDTNLSLLQHLAANQQDWMHSCGGKGRCTTCKFNILDGNNNIAEETPAELGYRASGRLKPSQRLACQAIIEGDITISVPAENQLPHLSYSV